MDAEAVLAVQRLRESSEVQNIFSFAKVAQNDIWGSLYAKSPWMQVSFFFACPKSVFDAPRRADTATGTKPPLAPYTKRVKVVSAHEKIKRHILKCLPGLGPSDGQHIKVKSRIDSYDSVLDEDQFWIDIETVDYIDVAVNFSTILQKVFPLFGDSTRISKLQKRFDWLKITTVEFFRASGEIEIENESKYAAVYASLAPSGHEDPRIQGNQFVGLHYALYDTAQEANDHNPESSDATNTFSFLWYPNGKKQDDQPIVAFHRNFEADAFPIVSGQYRFSCEFLVHEAQEMPPEVDFASFSQLLLSTPWHYMTPWALFVYYQPDSNEYNNLEELVASIPPERVENFIEMLIDDLVRAMRPWKPRGDSIAAQIAAGYAGYYNTPLMAKKASGIPVTFTDLAWLPVSKDSAYSHAFASAKYNFDNTPDKTCSNNTDPVSLEEFEAPIHLVRRNKGSACYDAKNVEEMRKAGLSDPITRQPWGQWWP